MHKRPSWSGAGGLGGIAADAGDVTAVGSPVRRSPIHWLILCGVVLIAAIVLGTAVMVDNFRERALSSSERELENTVLLLARHFDQQLKDAEVIQNSLVEYIYTAGIATPEEYRRRMSGEDVHQMLRAKLSAMSYVGAVNLFDAKGRIINASGVWPIPDVSVADRAYFKVFTSGPQSAAVLIEPVYSRVTGAWTTIIARKVTGTDGEFLGVISRGIEPAHFETFFASLALGDDAAISMFDREGTLLARYPHNETMIGRSFKGGTLLELVRPPQPDHGTMRLKSPINGEDRVGAVRRLSNFPITVVATTSVSAALADWREQTRFLTGIAALSAFIVAIILFLVVREISRQHQSSQRRLALEKQRLDTAVNNMTQGLLFFDSSHRLVICNQRYIEMFNVSRDVVKPGCTFRELLMHRKDTGTFTGDVDEYCGAVIRNMADGNAFQRVLDSSDDRSIQVLYQPLADGGWVTTLEDFTERRRYDERIAHLAHYDALTDLPNRTLFREQLERELRNVGGGRQLAVLYIDIDEFKSVNDSLGHPIGDELLKAVASRLSGCVKQADFVARLGGDEFAIVQTAVAGPADVMKLVIRIYEAIRAPCECLGHHLVTDASIGIALAPQDGIDLDQLLKNADLAMYGAKSDGRRTYRFFERDMDARVRARRALELDLRQTIVDGGFEIEYQPIVDLRSGAVSGCEALLRWRHPERGMVSPAEFIPVAEEIGLISQLGAWVLEQACFEAAIWPDDVRLAVNVSPIQFRSRTLALHVASVLASSGLAANRLELEITEAVLIRDDDSALAILHQLRALGIRIALDDFGTGYSSLSYLQRFPFDKIKIDRCFISELAEPEGSWSIVQAVVNIACARNMTTTAEGVETEAQKQLLCTLGCTEMQGYLFSKARPAPEVRRLLTQRVGIEAVA
ncbi:EAL domain-containing protein [uncultured Bradyrhizobium sp.]|uniref:bifunctional diguanylate cyclase/phosphodiesterase n=1 Tax=uncultured Bradyrhizobium sp. TaxID=199684 RepID=UPI0035C9BE82